MFFFPPWVRFLSNFHVFYFFGNNPDAPGARKNTTEVRNERFADDFSLLTFFIHARFFFGLRLKKNCCVNTMIIQHFIFFLALNFGSHCVCAHRVQALAFLRMQKRPSATVESIPLGRRHIKRLVLCMMML